MKRLLATLSLLLVLSTGCGYAGLQDLPLPGSPDVGDHSFVVDADFNNVLSLARQSTVRLDGVVVGRVEQIQRVGWTARVTMRLRGDIEVPANVDARIAQSSLLGEKYVDLLAPVQPAAARLGAGAHIPVADTSRGREVEEVLGAMSLLLNGGGLGQLRTIAVELDHALGDQVATKQFIRQLNTFVTTLDRNRSTIISSLQNVDRLSRQLARERGTVSRAITQISGALTTLAGQRRQIVGMLAHLDSFSQVTTRVIQRSGTDLVATLRALEPVLAQLDNAGNDLPRVLKTVLSFPFPDEVLNAVKGDYVNLDVLMDLSPLTIGGNVLGGAGSTPNPLGPLVGLLSGLGVTGVHVARGGVNP